MLESDSAELLSDLRWGKGRQTICYVRKKIDAGFERKMIHTVCGMGYQFGVSGEEHRDGHHAE